jgi:DNA polymerase epsilon subunit 1
LLFSFQGVANPVPRVQHPDWLHKKIVEKNDTLKQRKISEMFTRGGTKRSAAHNFDQENRPVEGGGGGGGDDEGNDAPMRDIEDGVGSSVPRPLGPRNIAVITTTAGSKRKNNAEEDAAELGKNWREVLGNPPRRADGLREWIKFQKRKWQFQARQRREQERRDGSKRARSAAMDADAAPNQGGVVRSGPVTMAGEGSFYL